MSKPDWLEVIDWAWFYSDLQSDIENKAEPERRKILEDRSREIKDQCYRARKQIEELISTLKEAVDCYGKPGGPWNVPSDPGGWLERARAALRKAGEKV